MIDPREPRCFCARGNLSIIHLCVLVLNYGVELVKYYYSSVVKLKFLAAILLVQCHSTSIQQREVDDP